VATDAEDTAHTEDAAEGEDTAHTEDAAEGEDAAHAEDAAEGEAPSDRRTEDDIEKLATRLFDMARRGDTAGLDAYLAAGVPPDLNNQSGDTLVMLAAYHGHAATVDALVVHGADPNRANDKGQTPIAGAVFKGEVEVVEALLRGGADPRLGHPNAVDTARMFGRDDLVALFDNAPGR
jgi:uncharacterized protein